MSAPFQGKSVGGHPSSAVPAQMAGGVPATSLAPSTSSPASGGQDWVGDVRCLATMKDTGWPCEGERKGESLYCFGHRSFVPHTEE